MTSSASASTDIQVSRDQSAEDDTEHSARQIDESSENDGSNGVQKEKMRVDESSEEDSGDGDVEEDDGSEDVEDGDGSGDDNSDRDEAEHMDTDVDTDGTITDGKDSSSDEESDAEYKRHLNQLNRWGVENEPGHDTPLHNAADNGHLQIVKMLLHSGIDVNTKGKYERTALHLAVKKANSEVISLLIDKGC
ncbi:transcription initiation factor TFIID subunit 11-like [Ptychodera flava]|uniref:transcription initiation factor TFIID subunit 11-like n=1 Tax=Ptychodera flava TaxID=63121 RepID=UPI003969E3AF